MNNNQTVSPAMNPIRQQAPLVQSKPLTTSINLASSGSGSITIIPGGYTSAAQVVKGSSLPCRTTGQLKQKTVVTSASVAYVTSSTGPPSSTSRSSTYLPVATKSVPALVFPRPGVPTNFTADARRPLTSPQLLQFTSPDVSSIRAPVVATKTYPNALPRPGAYFLALAPNRNVSPGTATRAQLGPTSPTMYIIRPAGPLGSRGMLPSGGQAYILNPAPVRPATSTMNTATSSNQMPQQQILRQILFTQGGPSASTAQVSKPPPLGTFKPKIIKIEPTNPPVSQQLTQVMSSPKQPQMQPGQRATVSIQPMAPPSQSGPWVNKSPALIQSGPRQIAPRPVAPMQNVQMCVTQSQARYQTVHWLPSQVSGQQPIPQTQFALPPTPLSSITSFRGYSVPGTSSTVAKKRTLPTPKSTPPMKRSCDTVSTPMDTDADDDVMEIPTPAVVDAPPKSTITVFKVPMPPKMTYIEMSPAERIYEAYRSTLGVTAQSYLPMTGPSISGDNWILVRMSAFYRDVVKFKEIVCKLLDKDVTQEEVVKEMGPWLEVLVLRTCWYSLKKFEGSGEPSSQYRRSLYFDPHCSQLIQLRPTGDTPSNSKLLDVLIDFMHVIGRLQLDELELSLVTAWLLFDPSDDADENEAPGAASTTERRLKLKKAVQELLYECQFKRRKAATEAGILGPVTSKYRTMDVLLALAELSSIIPFFYPTG